MINDHLVFDPCDRSNSSHDEFPQVWGEHGKVGVILAVPQGGDLSKTYFGDDPLGDAINDRLTIEISSHFTCDDAERVIVARRTVPLRFVQYGVTDGDCTTLANNGNYP